MEHKKTNVCFSADLSDKDELLKLVDLIGPEICLLKTHYDIIQDFDHEFVKALQDLAHKHQFLIFEDRKFADIGTTVRLQYKSIAQWADIVNAHVIAGAGTIEGLKEVGLLHGNGLLLIAQMSSKGNLLDDNYEQTAVQLAHEYREFVIGFIAQERLEDDSSFLYLTPGIRLEPSKGLLGQCYTTPYEAIAHRGNDIIIVGSGIYKAHDPLNTAKLYKDAGWQAYQERLNQ